MVYAVHGQRAGHGYSASPLQSSSSTSRLASVRGSSMHHAYRRAKHGQTSHLDASRDSGAPRHRPSARQQSPVHQRRLCMKPRRPWRRTQMEGADLPHRAPTRHTRQTGSLVSQFVERAGVKLAPAVDHLSGGGRQAAAWPNICAQAGARLVITRQHAPRDCAEAPFSLSLESGSSG